MIAVLVASIMLAVPFSVSTDSYAEEPMSDWGIYFETDAPLTNNADIVTILGNDGVIDVLESAFDIIGIMDIDGITHDLLTEFAIKKGALSKFDNDKVYDDTYEITSGKISGEFVNNETYPGAINFVGENALELYRYIDGESKLSNGTFTVDLEFETETYIYNTDELFKVGDKYYASKTITDTYMYNKVTGTISFVPAEDPEVIKSFVIDSTSAIQGTSATKFIYEVSNNSDITEDTVTYLGESTQVNKFEIDNNIEFDGKKENFASMMSLIYTTYDDVPIIYEEETAEEYDFDTTDYDLGSLLDNTEADDTLLKEKCDSVGTVGETYALASAEKPPMPSSDDDDDEGSNIPLYIGIGVGGLAVVGLAVFFLLRRGA